MARSISAATSRHRKSPRPEPRLVIYHDRHVSALIQIIGNKLSGGASNLYRKRFGFGTIEFRIIALLAIKPGISPQVISQTIGFDKAAISRSIRDLQKRKFVEITPNVMRMRSLHVTLTDSGYKIHDEMIPIGIERERRFTSCLSKAEVALMLKILARLQKTVPYANSTPTSSRPAKTPRAAPPQ